MPGRAALPRPQLVVLVAILAATLACNAPPATSEASPGDALTRRQRIETVISGDAAASPTATVTPSPTPTPTPTPTPQVFWPIRGTLAASVDVVKRRPIAVRIPNDVAARPQSGLAKADMVWELLAEGGITRYMAVFHSDDVDQIGPIRSARLSDLHYLPMLRGILAHVGAQPIVLRHVREAAAKGAFVDVDQFGFPGAYQRVSWRPAPQNVYTSTRALRAAAEATRDAGPVDVPALRFAPEPPAGGVAARAATIPYQGAMEVTYSYDATGGGYRRAQRGAPTIDAATGQPVLAATVVVIHTDIDPVPGIVEDSFGSLSLEIRSTGTGPATLFRDGQRFDGTWSREGTAMYRFADAGGVAIPLKPGQTWVHVIPASWAVTSAP